MTDNNSESSAASADADVSNETQSSKESAPARKRPKPGERRLQILQTLAVMLQEPNGDRVTTAALAARLQVSEAALYRHFASKAQMFEGLIEFIEQTLFGLINQITTNEADSLKQLRAILLMMIGFSEKNPGMTRVLVGDALVTEDDRLQVRINQLHDRLEASLKQCFRNAVVQTRLPAETDAGIRANLFLSFVLGRWLRYAKSGFKRMPSESLEQHVPLLLL
jgi:TetR/AcrR family transcriptional regulator